MSLRSKSSKGTKSDRPLALNPLTMFPSKNDSLVGVFYGVEGPKLKKKHKSKDIWLDPEHVDPNFGLSSDRSKDTSIRKTVRRLGTNSLFNPQRSDSVSISELMGPTAPTTKKFVLVEESRISELVKLEKILSDEKSIIGEQCAWLLNDVSLSARIPVPAVRLAMHNLCESEMRVHAKAMSTLCASWYVHCKQNHYDRPHNFPKDSYVNCAPISQRTLKLKLMKDAQLTFRRRLDRDCMAYEDELSGVSAKYLDAKERKVDYDRYYVLATRYGYMTEEEFTADYSPGKRYWRRAVDGCLKFQRLWDRYWALRKIVCFKAARNIQKIYRGMKKFKENNPLIRMRLRVGKRSYYRQCMKWWREYLKILKFCKDTAAYLLADWKNRCFQAWAGWAREQRRHKDEIMRRFVMRIKMGVVVVIVNAWRGYAKARKAGRVQVVRLLNNPFFGRWADYTVYSLQMKFLASRATMIQSTLRMRFVYKIFRRKKIAHRKLRHFAGIILCRAKADLKREVVIESEFQGWISDELERKLHKANENERRRLMRIQQQIAGKEKSALSELAAHLKSRDGQHQLSLIAAEVYRDRKRSRAKSTQHATEIAEKRLRSMCSDIVRQIERHDFNVKNPPFIRCPDVKCHTICVNEDQYHNHLQNTPHHVQQNSPQYSYFHLMLRNARGIDLLKQFVSRTQGIGALAHCIDCYAAIQEWRKASTKLEAYATKILNIYETFFSPDASRPVIGVLGGAVDAVNILVERLDRFKHRQFKGFFSETVDEPSAARTLLGMKGYKYTRWTLDNSFAPAYIDEVEWALFINMYHAVMGISDVKQDVAVHISENAAEVEALIQERVKDEETGRFSVAFQRSPEYRQYLTCMVGDAAGKRNLIKDEYRIVRMNSFYAWGFEFKKRDVDTGIKAGEVVDQILDAQAELLLERLVRRGVQEAVDEASYHEQIPVEMQTNLLEDATFWAEDTCLDEIFQFFVPSMLDTMLGMPDLRKGLLEYAGILQGSSKKKLKFNISKDQNSSKEWFDKFLQNAVEEEKDEIPMDTVQATNKIQKIVRSRLGRNRMRKLVAANFVKMYDQESQCCYYANLKTGETSWERPKLMTKLWPDTNY